MTTLRDYSLREESFDSQCKAGRFSPATEIKFRDKNGTHVHTLGCGTCDEVCAFREEHLTIVLSYSERHNYAGIQVFAGDESYGDLFLQSEEDLYHILGERGLGLVPINMAKRMLEALC